MAFPVNITNNEKRYSSDLNDFFIREGMPWAQAATATVTTPSGGLLLGNITGTGGAYSIRPTDSTYIKRIVVRSSRTIKVQITTSSQPYKGSNDYTNPDTYNRLNLIFTVYANTPYEISDHKVTQLGYDENIYFSLMGYDSGDTNPIIFSAEAYGYAIAKDRDITADNVVMFIGDSITAGAGGNAFEATNASNEEVFSQQVKRSLIMNGYRFRMCNKGVSGITSSGVVKCIKWGYYDIDKCDLIVCMIGTNDPYNVAGGGIAGYMNDIKYIINYKKARYPNAKLLMVGMPPVYVGNTTQNAGFAIMRPAVQTLVTQINDPNISYVSLENAFDNTLTSNFLPSDTVHPTRQNNMANIIFNHLENTWYPIKYEKVI